MNTLLKVNLKRTPLFRLIHIDNLEIVLQRNGMHAPNNIPNDGLQYKIIHNSEIQERREIKTIKLKNGIEKGVIHDYVPFYFGPRSPMLYQLHTGQVDNYLDGQEPLIYLVSIAQDFVKKKIPFVFSDGHGLVDYTFWYDNLDKLNKLNWNFIYAKQWNDIKDNPYCSDRKRQKQAEFLIYKFCKTY
ncbi:MAG: DUF4433 domain-containing protein, partial [Spirochaetota bacterium]